jgi:DNA-binding SARP family transcriptional activator
MAQLNAVDRDWLIKILWEIGDIDISRLDWRRALRAFEQICNLDPNEEKAQIQVIDLQLRLGQDDGGANAVDHYLKHLVDADRGAEILPMLEDLAREFPGRTPIHKRLAEAYRAVGRKADAIAQYDALAEILLDSGNVQEASNAIKSIIELEPPGVEGYRELLTNLESGA